MAIILAGILVSLIYIVVWFIPFAVILFSKKNTDPKEKALWILASIFFSWFAWIFYLLFAPIMGSRSYR